ncbi:MAG: two-component regulator propeller domain-containing protein, partial [Saprospiraceae bacterium]
MFSFWVKTLLIAGLLAAPGRVLAQLKIERSERLSLEQGLSDQDVRDLHCDAGGFLWLATGLNLERYDGYHFEHYNWSDSRQRLHGRNLVEIGESADACLYIRYSNSPFIDLLHTREPGCDQVFLDARNFLAGQLRATCMEKRGDFFALSVLPEALVIWRLSYNHLFEKVCALPWPYHTQETFKVLKLKAGGFWMHSSERGLFHLNAKGKILQHFENKKLNAALKGTETSLEKLQPAIFQEDGAGRFWLSFKELPGIFRFMKEQNDHSPRPWTGLSQQTYFNRLWEDDHGNLLLGSPTPADKFVTSRLTGLRANGDVYDAAAILGVEDKIQDLYSRNFDEQVFLATYSGMYKIFLKNKGIRQYLNRSIKPGEFGAILRSITSDGHGHIFFALEERYWFQLDTRTNKLDTIVLTNARGQPIELVRSGGALAYDPAGYLWGISRIDERNQRYGLHRYDLTNRSTHTWPLIGYLTTFYRHPDGHFYLLFRSSESGGHLGIFDPRTSQYVAYTDADGTNPFAGRLPKYIVESRVHQGLFWIGTNDGLVAINWQQRTSRVYGTGESKASLNLSRPDILAIYEDEAGTLWLGTNGGGLNILYFENQDPAPDFPRPGLIKII